MYYYIKITDRVYISILMKKDSIKNIFIDKMNKVNKYLTLLLNQEYIMFHQSQNNIFLMFDQ
jgi:hypothetical protein